MLTRLMVSRIRSLTHVSLPSASNHKTGSTFIETAIMIDTTAIRTRRAYMYLRIFRLAAFLDGLAWVTAPWIYMIGVIILTVKLLGIRSAYPEELPGYLLVASAIL